MVASSKTKKTRPDLDDAAWLKWLGELAENRGIDVYELYRKMVAWCVKKREQPTRRRLLKWIEITRESVPIEIDQKPVEKKVEEPQLPDCEVCNNERFVMTIVNPDAKYVWAREGMVP